MTENISNATYHADTSAISASGLKLFMKAPALYYAAYLDPERVERQPTPAMMLGTATHCAILEPGEFDNRYTVIPEGIDGRTKEGKQLWADLLATGKQPLADQDWQRIKRMAERFHADPDTGIFMRGSYQVELSIYGEVNGVKCKCRPDWKSNVIHRLMDVKTTSDASEEGFGKSAWRLGYHIQAAFYQRVYYAAFGIVPDFIFAAIESDYPYLPSVYNPFEGDDGLALQEYANELIDDALARYADCLARNEWPGYGRGVKPLKIPGYAQRMIEQGDGEVEVNYV